MRSKLRSLSFRLISPLSVTRRREASVQLQQGTNEDQQVKPGQANLGRSALEVQNVLMTDVHEFMGDAPQIDDISLVVVVRDSS